MVDPDAPPEVDDPEPVLLPVVPPDVLDVPVVPPESLDATPQAAKQLTALHNMIVRIVTPPCGRHPTA